MSGRSNLLVSAFTLARRCQPARDGRSRRLGLAQRVSERAETVAHPVSFQTDHTIETHTGKTCQLIARVPVVLMQHPEPTKLWTRFEVASARYDIAKLPLLLCGNAAILVV